VKAGPPAPGTYTYQVTTTYGGCPGGSQNVVVVVNPLPTVSVNSSTICQGSSATVVATPGTAGNYSYSWTVPTGATNPGNISSFTTSVPGTYTVVIRNTITNCASASASGVVTLNSVDAGTIGSNQTICTGNIPGPFTASAATGAGLLTYQWQSSSTGCNGAWSNIAGANSAVYAAPAGLTQTISYRRIVTSTLNSLQCTDTTNCVTVTVNPLPTATISGNSTICSGQTTAVVINLTGTAPWSITYTDGTTIFTINNISASSYVLPLSPVATTTYSLVSVNDANCPNSATGSAIVTVNPLPTATISGNATICAGALSPKITFSGANGTAPYTFVYRLNGGSPIAITTGSNSFILPSSNVPGTYVYTLVSVSDANGCSNPQTGIATVTVNPITTSVTNVTVCSNQLPYNWNGTNYSAVGVYTFTTTNAAGCDSVATLNLTIKATSTSTTNISICPNQMPYNWNGTSYNAGGVYTFITTNAAGCDSIATLNLTIKATTTSTTNVAVCSNQLPYNWNGTNYSAAGSYTFTTTNAAGCDSVATMNLSTKATSTSTTSIAVCSNQLPYNWNGTNYSAAGFYTFTTTNGAGCDSVATLNLLIRATSTSTTNVAVCSNQLPYNWNGTNYSAAGSYTFTTTNAAGCDSVATLNLSVPATITSASSVTVCSNQLPYNWNGTNYSAAGSYTFTTTNAAGCDSVATLNLSTKSTSTSTTNVAVCSNQLPYNWNGTNYSAAGSYTFTTTNAAGCDSVATLTLTIKSPTTSTTNVAVCSNQLPYNWNGTNYNTAGSYTFTTTNAAGCDSVATLNMSIKATTVSTTNVAVCSNQLPYNWNGTNYNTAGSYTFTTTNAAGCDSVATLNMSIKATTVSTANVAVCSNQLPYNWNGTNYSTAGSYTFTTTNAAGCDSVATLNMSIKSPTTSTTNVAVCSNQLPYNWNGTNYSAAGSYTFTTTNAAGCDSVATLTLTIKLPTTSTTNVAVCSNQLPYNWNGTNYSAAGSYTFTTTNAAGCDSVATLNLSIKATTVSTTNVAVCSNQLPYNWNGANYSTAGSYTFTTTNAAGCDSVATLNMSIKATTVSTTNVAVCSNQLPYNWNGTNYNTAGSYTFTTTNAAGCDSVATLNMSIKATTVSTANVAVCSNQLPYNWNGTNYSTAGSYTFTTTNAAGCDSGGDIEYVDQVANHSSTTNVAGLFQSIAL
jgi:hypothetical protein